MPIPQPDLRSERRKALDEQLASEPHLPHPDVLPGEPRCPLETHLRHRRPVAVVGVVENGLVRLLDPRVRLPEQSRVIVVAAEPSWANLRMWVQAIWHSPPGHSAPATQRPAGIPSRTIHGLIAYLCQIAQKIISYPFDRLHLGPLTLPFPTDGATRIARHLAGLCRPVSNRQLEQSAG
jgi:hypothetical protein